MKKEELEVLKQIGSKAKTKNLWLKVYDDEKEEDGLISVLEILEEVIKDINKLKEQEGK